MYAGIEPSGCLENPCQNGAQCIEEDDSFTCVCQPGFEGPRCEYGKGKNEKRKVNQTSYVSIEVGAENFPLILLHWMREMDLIIVLQHFQIELLVNL